MTPDMNNIHLACNNLDIQSTDTTTTVEQQSTMTDTLESLNLETDSSVFEDFIETETSQNTNDYDNTASELNSLMERMTLKVTQQKADSLGKSKVVNELETGEEVSVCSGEKDVNNRNDETVSPLTDKSPLLCADKESQGESHITGDSEQNTTA